MKIILSQKNISLALSTLVIFVLFSLLTSTLVFAQQDSYVPISNLGPPGPSAPVDISNPDNYFRNLFNIFIVLASVLAVIRLMLCGIQYMASESVSSKGAAKTCISYVIGGIFLILVSYLLLQTINPDLVNSPVSGIITPP